MVDEGAGRDSRIRVVSRYDPMFVGRRTTIYAAKPDLSVDWSVDPTYIPIPEDLIICDSCNAKIITPEVKLFEYTMDEGKTWYVYGARCDVCVEKRYSEFPVVRDT